jgi:hypothetical protein
MLELTSLSCAGRQLSRLAGGGSLVLVLSVALSACTKYTVATSDGGGGGSSQTGSGGAAVSADASDAVDRFDAPVTDTAPSDAGLDLPQDTGPGFLANGASCSVGTECQSGNCVDGHCCGAPSCGPCQSCTGTAGACAPIDNGIDNDSCTGGTCQGGVCKPHGSILWARSTSNAWLYSAIDGPAGVVTTGTITVPLTANLGGSTLTPVGATDAVLGQFASSDATHISSSRFGGSTPSGTGNVYATGSILDASGAAIVHGVTYCDATAASPCTQINLGLGLVSPGGGPGADGFVGRYSVNTGMPTWAATLKGPTDDLIKAVTTGPNGTIYVAAWYDEGVGQNTTLTSGSSVLQFAGAGDRDILVAQFDSSTGAIGMTKTFKGPGFEEPHSIAWTGANIIVAGDLAGPAVSFGQTSLASVGDFDVWVAKLAPSDGTAIWAIRLGGPARDVYPFIAVDSAGDIYVAGTVGSPTAFGTFPVGGAGLDIFVAKLRNSDGSVVWAKSFGSTGDDGASAIAINSSGQIVVSGDISGPLQAGGAFSGATDAVLASFASDGTQLWTKVIGTSGSDHGSGVTNGSNAFYAAIDLASDIGPTIEGVPIVGAAAPVGLLLKIQP